MLLAPALVLRSIAARHMQAVKARFKRDMGPPSAP